MTEELIKNIREQIANCKKFNQDPNDCSWGYEEGVLLSANEAEQIIKEIDGIPDQIAEARMEQDCINQKYILDKHDEIVKQAKIEENEYWKHQMTTYSFYSPEIFDPRITELKGGMK